MNRLLYICSAVIALVIALTSCSETDQKADISAKKDASVKIQTLADDIWADMLAGYSTSMWQSATYLRLQEGLPIHEFEDITLEKYHKGQKRAAELRQRLATIDATQLTGDDLITYEILVFELKDIGANDDDYWLTFDLSAYVGPYLFQYDQQALAVQKITDKASTDHYLMLVGEFADMIDQLLAKTLGQMERGIYMPRPALPAVRATWSGMSLAVPDVIRVADERLYDLPENEKDAFNRDLEKLIESRVTAGFDALLAVIGDDYEAKAPEAVGIGQYPGGAEVYKRNVRKETTLDLTPEEIHQRGKKAVAEISARMKDIRDELGYKGSAKDFIDQLKTDTRFIAQTPAEVEARYMGFIRRIEPKLDAYFKYQPRAPYGVKRLALASEAGMTFGYYSPPTASEPTGYYNYNGSDLANRSLIGAGPLIYHELLPGHHFHIATQAENETLQPYRKKYSVGAYTEGWAEYAASLGIEMGMYETPYEMYGRYIMEMFLATRLVVDTGMNAFGWSLEEARAYMLQYVFHSEVEIASETLRYSTSIPGQALNYRIGYEKHWELRRRAEAALGDKFDIRDYHNVVLSDGAKPLTVLEAKVDRYIEAAMVE